MRTLILFLSMSLLAACSDDNGPGAVPCAGCQLPPLTAEQQTRMNRVSQEFDGATKGGMSHKEGVNQLPPQPPFQRAFKKARQAFGQDDFIPVSQNSSNTDYDKYISEAIATGQCVVSFGQAIFDDIDQPSNDELISSPTEVKPILMDFIFEIGANKAATCPLYVQFGMSMQWGESQSSPQSASFKGDLAMNAEYRAKPGTDLYENTDLTSYKTDFDAEVLFTTTQADDFAFSIKGGGETTVVTKETLEGEILIAQTLSILFSGDQESGRGQLEYVVRYRFQDFEAIGLVNGVFDATTGENGRFTYQINGEFVSEEEFAEIFSGALMDQASDEIVEEMVDQSEPSQTF